VSNITGTPEITSHQLVTSSLHPNEEVFALVHKLKANYQLGIISNVGSPLGGYFPDGYLNDFTVQTLSFEVGVIKPSPEIYRLHLQKSGFLPDEAIFIDDRLTNCDAAKESGLHSVLFQGVDQLLSDLRVLRVNL